MGLTAELNVCGNRAADLSRANETESSEAGLEVEAVSTKEGRRAKNGGKKDLCAGEEKNYTKSDLIRNSDGVSL